MSGIKNIDEAVHVTDYDPEWPLLFKKEKTSLYKIFGTCALGIEHFGSTSAPGLSAKPIIDILIGLSNPLPPVQSEALEAVGYTSFGEAGISGRLYFTKRLPLIGYNLAVTAYDSVIWKDNILIRNYLRAHPEAARQYALVKEECIASGANSTLSYSQCKYNFVQALLAQARAWSLK